jgi:hypothetical protein
VQWRHGAGGGRVGQVVRFQQTLRRLAMIDEAFHDLRRNLRAGSRTRDGRNDPRRAVGLKAVRDQVSVLGVRDDTGTE